MIVRNEAGNLGACLDSLAGLASQIVVVDTGSTDETAQIATGRGAEVHHFAWIDDFSAARNESLEHATMEWVFWLDADDRLSPEAVAQLKRAVASGTADAYACRVSSRKANGNLDIAEHLRLFRNHLGVSFSGAIHETASPSAMSLGLRIARTDITVEHTGYAPQDAIEQKARRNLEILERSLANDPDNAVLLFYRGQTRGALGDLREAESDVREYLARTSPNDPSAAWMRFWSYSHLLAASKDRGEFAAIRHLVAQALAEFPEHPQFRVFGGEAATAMGEHQEALKLFRAAYDGLEVPVLGCVPSRALLETHIAGCYRVIGDRENALRWAELAWKHAPEFDETGALVARLCVETGGMERAESILAGLLDRPGWDAWLVLAELRYRQGRPADAAKAIDEARARGLSESKAEEFTARLKAAVALAATRTAKTEDESGRHQMEGMTHLARKDFLSAAECFTRAIEADPNHADGYRYLAVALQKLGREKEAREAWLASTQLRMEPQPA